MRVKIIHSSLRCKSQTKLITAMGRKSKYCTSLNNRPVPACLVCPSSAEAAVSYRGITVDIIE